MTQQDAETLRDFSKVLWGSEVWKVTLGIQHRFEHGYSPEDLEYVWLDFREPLPVPESTRKHRRVGSLWISISTCGVRVEQRGKTLINGGDSVSKVLDQFPKMVGSRLLEADVRPPGGDATFTFENDLTLNCFPARSRDRDCWIIYTEDGNRLKLGPGTRITYNTDLR